jgi:hypothetical protein
MKVTTTRNKVTLSMEHHEYAGLRAALVLAMQSTTDGDARDYIRDIVLPSLPIPIELSKKNV